MACIQIDIIEEYIHPDGKQYIYVGRRWTYRATISSKVAVTSNTEVYLSYAGSTAIHGTSFDAPNKVTIKSGKYYVDFEVIVNPVSTSYQKFVKVVGSTTSLSKCNESWIQILSRKSTPHFEGEYPSYPYNPDDHDDPDSPNCNPNPRVPGKDCCAYYDKTYEIWRDYYPTCMGNIGAPLYPDATLRDGTQSPYEWDQHDSV